VELAEEALGGRVKMQDQRIAAVALPIRVSHQMKEVVYSFQMTW
jgi:hypothetical protein